MLRSAKELRGYVLQALDGEIGRSKDFLFDDQQWALRYLVADTAKWLPGRKVLISPVALGSPDWASHRFPVELTRDKIKNAPSLDEDASVSRQYQARYHHYFDWPPYWNGIGGWAATAYPAPLFTEPKPNPEAETAGDPHLRSIREVAGYKLQATDGDLGKVDDFIVDDGTWVIRYLVVDTSGWLMGRKVLIAPDWAEKVSWTEGKVFVGLTRDQVKASPVYEPNLPVNREYEAQLYDYYGRPQPWI